MILKSKNTETVIQKKVTPYKIYINSSSWINKSKQFIKNAKKCQRCGSFYGLGCHHKNYNNIGKETYKDIIVLCWDCHKKFHRNLKGKKVHMFKYFEKMELENLENNGNEPM